MSKKTIGLVVGLLILTVFLVALAMQSSRQAKPTPQKEEVTKTPTVTVEAKTRLFMSPDPVSMVGNRATIMVKMDSQDNNITAVQLEVSYDPKVLSFVSISPESSFAEGVPLLNTVDRKNGRISYAVGLSPSQAKNPLQGESDVATLIFNRIGSATASASTEVTFLPKSLVSASGISQSVLKESAGTTVLLKSE